MFALAFSRQLEVLTDNCGELLILQKSMSWPGVPTAGFGEMIEISVLIHARRTGVSGAGN